jgi:hypothetical protein
MKLKHIILFFLSCVLLNLSDIYAGPLIALALLFQMNILIFQIPLTKQSQIAAFKLFLCSVPLFFFFGGIHSFVTLYFDEHQWLYFFFASIVTYFLSFVAVFISSFVFEFLQQGEYNINLIYQYAFNEIKNRKKTLFMQSLFVFILSVIPIGNSDWKIIFSLVVTQFYFQRSRLKQVFWP